MKEATGPVATAKINAIAVIVSDKKTVDWRYSTLLTKLNDRLIEEPSNPGSLEEQGALVTVETLTL